MHKLSLLKILKWKVIWVLIFFTCGMVAYFHVVSLQSENEQNIRRLSQIVNFLAGKAPPRIFAAIEPTPPSDTFARTHLQPQLQSLLDELCLPLDFIRYGYYSKRSSGIVAFGPQYDLLMLSKSEPARLRSIHDSTSEQLVEESNSFIWSGANAITYIRPILHEGEIVGHAFASVNQNLTSNFAFQRTLWSIIGAVFMLLGAIMIFYELFNRFEKDMRDYAASILRGEERDYEARLPELTPLFKFISDQMKRMTQIDRLNTIGEMAAGIAHEVRNPLTTIRCLLQMLTGKPGVEPYQNKFDMMIDEIDAANVVMTEFLSLSKDKVLYFEPTDLNQFIRKLHPLFKATAESKQLNLKVEVDLQELPIVQIDHNSMCQLLCNLVKNAFEAMPQGGTVTIRTASVEQGVQLSVQDEGCGVPENLLEKIGTPFLTTKLNGTGLGVSICSRTAQNHHGSMKIENNPDRGATFTFCFPLEQPEQSKKEVSS